MGSKWRYDAVVVGSGPNGLSAAITIARSGHSVLVLEAEDTIGGGTRSAELTMPGFVHDICSAVHPLGVSSPFFQSLPLKEYGLEWIQPPIPLAHPFLDGTAAVLERSLDATAESLGREDADAYRKLISPIVENWPELIMDALGPLRLPSHPLVMMRFGLSAIRSARGLARSTFRGRNARALFAGIAAHSTLPLEETLTASFSLVLDSAAHAVGWPIAKGGSQNIANALAGYLRALGGEITTGCRVSSLHDLPPARAILLDVTPRQLLQIAGDKLPLDYFRKLQHFRYGPGTFKVDWALESPIPWQASECLRAGTIHVGGTLDEISESEDTVWMGRCPERPYVLLAQQSQWDPSRAPEGRQTAWGYCHVPNGSTFDMTARIEAQIERFAPGFRDIIIGRNVMPPAALEAHNANYIGGDINGGLQDLHQFFTRPVARLTPYSTPVRGLYLCSSSTPPGGAVHGMCGYYAATAALRQVI
jgi:phytoene dehydrogenase-like protein